jgi:hypothetical protein
LTAKKTWLTVGVAALIIGSVTLVKIPRRSTPFGLKLRPEASALAKQVEKFYGHAIVEDTTSPLHENFAASEVTEQGYPRIILSPQGHTEAILVHELMHLEFTSRGFPVLKFVPPGAENTEIGETLGATVQEFIEQWMFHPTMKQMGITPDVQRNPVFEQWLKTDAREERAYAPLIMYMLLSVRYFEAMLLLDDASLKERVSARFLRNDWTGPLAKGQSMVDHILQEKPSTPEEQLNCFLWCANVAASEVLSLTIDHMETKPKGNFLAKYIFIRVDVPKF